MFVKMTAKIIFFLLVTTCSYFQICYAIHCYKCQSTSNERYLDGKDDEIPKCGSDFQIVECPGETICQYFEISDNNTRTAVRTCAPPDGCKEFPEEDKEKILNCYTCSEDLCNEKSKEPACTTLTMDINLNINLNIRNLNDNNTFF